MFKCLFCSKENDEKRNHANKYCDNLCQQQYELEHKTMPKFRAGSITTPRTLHRCLSHLHGYKCCFCGNEGMYNGMPLALQVDHIDGNASNNIPENLRLLCPNCHSQTETYVARNKGNGKRLRK